MTKVIFGNMEDGIIAIHHVGDEIVEPMVETWLEDDTNNYVEIVKQNKVIEQ